MLKFATVTSFWFSCCFLLTSLLFARFRELLVLCTGRSSASTTLMSTALLRSDGFSPRASFISLSAPASTRQLTSTSLFRLYASCSSDARDALSMYNVLMSILNSTKVSKTLCISVMSLWFIRKYHQGVRPFLVGTRSPGFTLHSLHTAR